MHTLFFDNICYPTFVPHQSSFIMAHIVKITHNEDGEEIDNPQWCYVWNTAGSHHALCSMQVFGFGEGAAKFIERTGRITCPECIAIIKQFKSIKL